MTHQLELTDLQRSWVDDALAVIVRAKADMLPQTFTTDDLHAILPKPEHPNWYGVLLAKLRNSGVVEKFGYKPSARPSANGRVVAVWRRVSK